MWSTTIPAARLLLLRALQTGSHVFILVLRGHRIKRIHCRRFGDWPSLVWSLERERRVVVVVVNLYEFAAIVTALSCCSSTSSRSTVLVEDRRSPVLLVPYLGCVRLALRMRRPCWAPVLLAGCAIGLKGDAGEQNEMEREKRVVSEQFWRRELQMD